MCSFTLITSVYVWSGITTESPVVVISEGFSYICILLDEYLIFFLNVYKLFEFLIYLLFITFWSFYLLRLHINQNTEKNMNITQIPKTYEYKGSFNGFIRMICKNCCKLFFWSFLRKQTWKCSKSQFCLHWLADPCKMTEFRFLSMSWQYSPRLRCTHPPLRSSILS